MWPKAFAQLIELAPHISRLLPMADRFFQNKAAADDTARQTMEEIAAAQRSELRQLASSTEQLVSHISGVAQRIERVAVDAQMAKLTVEAVDQRLTRIESRQGRLTALAVLLLVLLLVAIALEAVVLAHSR